jgi:hypothetical protein
VATIPTIITIPTINFINPSTFFHQYITTTMADSYKTIEDRLQQAIIAIRRGELTKITQAAAAFDVPYQRLRARFLGRPSRSERYPTNLRLTKEEDAGLCQYLDRLDDLGISTRKGGVAATANLLLEIKYRVEQTKLITSPQKTPPRLAINGLKDG